MYCFWITKFFKRVFYLKQINFITGGPLTAGGPGQLPPLPPSLIRPCVQVYSLQQSPLCSPYKSAARGGPLPPPLATPLLLPVRGVFRNKLIKNYLRSNLAVEKSCLTVYRATIDWQYKFQHCHWRICQQKGKKGYCVENCIFHFKNADGPNFLHFLNYFSLYVIFAFCLTVSCNVWVFWRVFKIYHIWACESTVIV